MQRPWGKGEPVIFQELKRGHADEILIVEGARTIFGTVKHSHLIAGSNSASWCPPETTALLPFLSGVS